MLKAIFDDRAEKGRNDKYIDLPKYFLWTKIGTESGESLKAIIRRKEIEREACDGIFFWGVGSSVGKSISTLSQLSEKMSVVFSKMRSQAKAVDANPSRVVIWLGYEDTSGNRHPLPPYSFVISRDTGCRDARRRAHYALLCESNSRLCEDPVGELDATALVNIRSGKPVGYSQVTSVVARSEPPAAATGPMLYPVTFAANLVGFGQVRLTDAVVISAADVARVAASAEEGTLAWKRAVVAVKSKLFDGSATRTSKDHTAQLDMLDTA